MLRLASIAVVWLMATLGAASCAPRHLNRELSLSQREFSDDEIAYMCPMHPDVSQPGPGKCPRCGMALTAGTPFDMRDYGLEVRTEPEAIRAGERTVLHLRVRHPRGEPVTKFEQVHEKPYHLFVVSQDLTFFQHVHPDAQEDGSWLVDVTLPKPGYYKLLSDFVPVGGTAQFLSYPLMTAGYSGDVMADGARLTPDATPTQTVGDLTASVSYDPAPMTPATHGHVTVQLTRAGTSEPVTDLQTYLGAFGHMLIVSEDAVDYVHSHPIEVLPPDANLETIRGGPTVIFEGIMPRAGRYRAWGQFRYRDTLRTFPFTFEVKELGVPSR